MDKKIGERIRKFREDQNYSQRAIADVLEITPGAYAKIERGETDPNVSRLTELAKIFGCDIMDLLKDNPGPIPKGSAGQFEELVKRVVELTKDMEKVKTQLAVSKLKAKK